MSFRDHLIAIAAGFVMMVLVVLLIVVFVL